MYLLVYLYTNLLISSIIDLLTIKRFHFQSLVGFAAQFFLVLVSIFHTINPFIQVFPGSVGGFADLIPGEIELIVAVIISLGVGGMAGKRHMAHRADHNARNHGPVRV